MTRRRGEAFSLDEALTDPGFTPRHDDVSELLERVAGRDDERRSRAEKALLKVQASVAVQLYTRAGVATPDELSRLLRLAGQLVPRDDDGRLKELMLKHLSSAHARVRRAAANALGRLRSEESETALLEALGREEASTEEASRDPRVLDAIVEALGKVGRERAARALAALPRNRVSPETLDRARLMLGRTALRDEPSRLVLDRALDGPLEVTFRCRQGLEPLLASEIEEVLGGQSGPRVPSGDRGRVDLTLRGAPAQLFAVRTFVSFGFPLPEMRHGGPSNLAADVVTLLASDAAKRILRTFTEGPIRFRLAWASGGKRRKTIWDVASEIQRRAPELVNDPTDSRWEVVVRETADKLRLELVPRFEDPRFAYRGADVPAASHPTLAAAIVRAAEIREDDVVWDPFVGSGGELCERFIAGPSAMLIGSDVDDRALAAARQNLDRAGATSALLRRADARTFDPRAIGGRAREGMTAIVSNPPMGRRVARGEDLEHLLSRVVSRAAEILVPGGRMVWLSPLPRITRAAAAAAGLSLRRAAEVDMGGFSAELQVLDRPKR